MPMQAVQATQSTANADPQYHVDLSLVGHVVAFQRHRSRLRAIQHQLRLGTVTPQPSTARKTVRALPGFASNDVASHRLYLLRRLSAFERRGVQWTQEEVESCMTMPPWSWAPEKGRQRARLPAPGPEANRPGGSWDFVSTVIR